VQTQPAGAVGIEPLPVSAGGAAQPDPASRLYKWVWLILPIVAYVAVSIVAFWPLAPWNAHTLPVCNCADYAKMTAFLEWTPWAILHGHNPFFTTYQDFPAGVNLAANTTMPFLGLLLAPITLTAGPIASMNLLSHVALAGSATTAFLVFRRWVRWTPAAAAGGLLFGFSPYSIAHSRGHPNLIFVVLLPVLLLLVDEIVVRQRIRPRNAGLLLGAVAAAQFGISSELLSDAALLTAAGLVVLAMTHRQAVRTHARHIARAAAWTVATFVVLAGYPLYMVLAGPRHIAGPIQSLSVFDKLRADLLSAVLPTQVQLFALHLGSAANRFVAGNVAENAAYVGIPLVLLLAAAAVVYRRDSRLVFALIMVAACYVVSLGPTLNVDGHVTSVPLPFHLLVYVPLLYDAISIRYFVFGYLFIALALALILDHLRAAAPWRALDARLSRSHLSRPALAGAVAVVALLPLVPKGPWPELPSNPRSVYGSYAVPPYFSDGGEQAIPAGSTVLVYPYSNDGYMNYSILWQAVGGERFRMTDGDASTPDGSGPAQSESPQLDPPLLENLLHDAYYGPSPPDVGSDGSLGPQALAEARQALRNYGFTTVVAAPVGRYPGSAISALSAILGHRPQWQGGVFVWYGVQQDLRDTDSAS
jgi:hypothetical protein